MIMKNYIDFFNPDVMLLKDIRQDYLINKIELFNAGVGNQNFNSFLTDDATDFAQKGNGVTYVVWNIQQDAEGNEIDRDCVAYYTLAGTSIPYEDRIRLDPQEAEERGTEYDITICGISSLEIKMFAIDNKYQNLFYSYDNEDLPIAAWILRNIINYAEELLENYVGFKSVFLHSVPEAEEFYLKNGFQPLLINMRPLHNLDSEYTPLYLSLREVSINYDD